MTKKQFTNPPFSHSFRITSFSNYILDQDNKLTIGAYLYDKNGQYVNADLVEVIIISDDYDVVFKTPLDNQPVSGTNTLPIEVEITGNKEISKVEIYAGSGALMQTLTNKPYTYNLDISNITCCFSSTYHLPLAVYAYDKDGNHISKGITVPINK